MDGSWFRNTITLLLFSGQGMLLDIICGNLVTHNNWINRFRTRTAKRFHESRNCIIRLELSDCIFHKRIKEVSHLMTWVIFF